MRRKRKRLRRAELLRLLRDVELEKRNADANAQAPAMGNSGIRRGIVFKLVVGRVDELRTRTEGAE